MPEQSLIDHVYINYCKKHQIRPYIVSTHHLNILRQPIEFYTNLIIQIRRARFRIYLSCLYIGVEELIQFMLRELLLANEKHANLKINIIIDKNDGLRVKNNNSSFLILLNFVKKAKFPERIKIYLFQHNKWSRFMDNVFGHTVRQVRGNFHQKVFIFDHNVLLTGGNLQYQYFINRKDRYVIINEEKAFSDFLVQQANCLNATGYRITRKGLEIPSWKSVLDLQRRCYLGFKNYLNKNQPSEKEWEEFDREIENFKKQGR